MGGQSRTIEERKIDGRSSVADYSVAGHGSDTSIDKSFSVPSALRSPPTRKRVRSKCVAAMRFTISRARGPRFVKKILLSSPRKTKKKKRSLLEGREREREKGNVACRLYCRPVWEILSFDLSAHSMPVSLRQEINDHGPPFQYDLPSEIISRESHGSERAAGSGRTAISSPHEGRI